MKVTKDTLKEIKYIHDFQVLENGIDYLKSLLNDVKDLNNIVDPNQRIFIDYNDGHTEYSSERTDPCPDYYGMFTLRFENRPHIKIGDEMNINELDTVICSLYDFVSEY